MKNVITFLCFALLTGILTACGGGGGSDKNNNSLNANLTPVGSNPGNTGRVTILVTDAPTTEFDHIYLTVTGVALLGGDNEPVTIFDGEKEIDLLSLRSFSEVFTINEAVPAGTYDKIRLLVSKIELVKEDDMGDVIEVIEPDVPANGKIDLNPRGQFTISDDSHTVVTIDIDADKSIKLVKGSKGSNGKKGSKGSKGSNGKSPYYKFRPVVFVKIETEEIDLGRLVKIEGKVTDIDVITATFTLCSDLPISNYCYYIVVEDSTSIFNTTPETLDISELVVGDIATVNGWTRYNDDIPPQLEVLAASVEIGASGAFAALSGVVTEEATPLLNGNKQIQLQIEDGQGFAKGTVISVELLEGTKLFNQHGETVQVEDIKLNDAINVSGIIALSSDSPDTVKATTLFIYMADDSVKVSGNVSAIDVENGLLTLVDGVSSFCITTAEDLQVFVITDGVSDEITLNELQLDYALDVYGSATDSDCTEANTIIAFAP